MAVSLTVLLNSSLAAADNTISGTVSLPGSATAPDGGMSLMIYTYDQNYNYYHSRVDIPEGETATSYSITVPTDLSLIWTVYYSFNDNYLYVNRGYYTIDGTRMNRSSATVLTGGSDYSGVDLTLLAYKTISGTVSLPASEAAPGEGISLKIVVGNQYTSRFYCVEDSFTFGYDYTEVDIPEGETSATYSINVPEDESVIWKVRYNISRDYPYLFKGYYNAGGTRPDPSFATALTGGSDYSGIDITLLKGITISGNVSLPGSEAAPGGGISLYVSAEDQNYNKYYSTVLIPEGETSVYYSINVPDKGSSVWTVKCYFYSGYPYFSEGYYNVDGTTWDESSATPLTGGGDYTGINLTLLERTVISGSVSLPGSAVAPSGGISLSMRANDQSTNTYYKTTVIAEGESTTTYSINVPKDTSLVWTVKYHYLLYPYYPYYYLPKGYYNSSGTTGDQSDATVLTGSSEYNDIDLVMLVIRGGDLDGNYEISLSDIILGLQVLSGLSRDDISINTGDCNKDLKIGLEEVIFGLKEIAN